MNRKTTNKGRITRPDQAWAAAHREHQEREAARQANEPRVCLTPKGAQLARQATGTDVAIQDAHKGAQDVQVIRATQPLTVPLRFLQAALITAAKDDIRYYLVGVYLHAIDGEVRICSTDGHRMIVSRYVPQGGVPAWAEAGVILPRADLAQVLPIMEKHGVIPGGHGDVTIDYAKGEERATLRSDDGFAQFSVKVIDGKFPDYAVVLASAGANLARGEGDAMRAPGINAKYLKGAGEIAARLEAKAVHAFIGGEDKAALFTFDGAPDTVLVIMPVRSTDPVSDSVVKMIGSNGISGSIAALRAHVTRTAKLLESAKSKKEREDLEARKSSFEERVAHLLRVVAEGPKQLEHKGAAS